MNALNASLIGTKWENEKWDCKSFIYQTIQPSYKFLARGE